MTGCGHLCASSKRMSRHWSDAHSASGLNNFASHARSVNLQTFFRGTKLKYFEVSVEDTAAESQSFAEGGGHDREDSSVDDLPSLPRPTSLFESSPVVDLETLTYFHHFIITTCLTLPKIEDPLPASQYWGICIVSLALQQRWLMCGLLAISAYHSATLEDETTAQQKHCERATKLRSEFFVGFNEIINNTSNTEPTETFQETKKAAIQVRSIVSCARWTLTEFTANQETVLGSATALPHLESLLCDIRYFASSEPGNFLETEHGNRGDIQTSLSTNSPQGTATVSTVLLNRLRMLPYRMAEIFGKPDHEQDALAILLGIGALLRYSDDLSGPWQGIRAWLNKTTDHFNHMVLLQDPAALIVLAHWAAILFQQAEAYECWFIHGFSRAIVLLISEQISTDDTVRGLVKDLLE
ncbi:hypothetical protein N7491_003963 [Penicillium cf. griseofulvum]|uniref:Transcription factor domain-containing protein n=1 Tax=Penicillium cf. griseofulvum TaxID=2972120 RepID=A0A9W9T104_9EURO|nr:hypothetical protein N7472_001860 [Penicillium cf. griseofulvum]KAJ5441557.1 hypothetical protein N7491_003963 [Penicillium cf. griseofulvum]